MLIALNTPFNLLCQFTDATGRRTLADFVTEKNVSPAARLDYDSEGLVLLTDDGALQKRIADRRDIPTAWLEITLSEGRNRQVRRMTAAVGHPTLRLVRVSIGAWSRQPASGG